MLFSVPFQRLVSGGGDMPADFKLVDRSLARQEVAIPGGVAFLWFDQTVEPSEVSERRPPGVFR